MDYSQLSKKRNLAFSSNSQACRTSPRHLLSMREGRGRSPSLLLEWEKTVRNMQLTLPSPGLRTSPLLEEEGEEAEKDDPSDG